MKKKVFLLIICSPLFLCASLCSGCKGKKKIYKNDLIGVYKIEDGISIDSTPETKALIKKSFNWTLSLMEKDNFEFKGDDKTIIGYWAFSPEDHEPKNSLLFQSGYMSEGIIYSRFDKTRLRFDNPCSMLDSIFKVVILKRIDK